MYNLFLVIAANTSYQKDNSHGGGITNL